MYLKKVMEHVRIEAGGGGSTSFDFKLKPSPGGSACKQGQLMLKITQRSSSAATVGIRLEHSADGMTAEAHTTPNPTAATFTTPPVVKSQDSDATKMIGENLHWIITVGGGATEWIFIESAWEMRKSW